MTSGLLLPCRSVNVASRLCHNVSVTHLHSWLWTVAESLTPKQTLILSNITIQRRGANNFLLILMLSRSLLVSFSFSEESSFLVFYCLDVAPRLNVVSLVFADFRRIHCLPDTPFMPEIWVRNDRFWSLDCGFRVVCMLLTCWFLTDKQLQINSILYTHMFLWVKICNWSACRLVYKKTAGCLRVLLIL